MGSIVLPAYVTGVAVAGNYAYIADTGGLRVINVANPAAPDDVGFYDAPEAEGVAVAGSYAYVADYEVGLRIINVANPSAPTAARRDLLMAWRWPVTTPTSPIG